MQALHRMILKVRPKCKLWFLDGKNDEGKTVSNPNIGYGAYTMKYTDGTTREFYQIGLSANKTGISVYILGIEDKKYLRQAYGKELFRHPFLSDPIRSLGRRITMRKITASEFMTIDGHKE